MTKRKNAARAPTGGANPDVTKPDTPPAAPAAVDVAMGRAVDQELRWYFSYAENALVREDVSMLPSYAAGRVLATSPTDEEICAAATALARRIEACLGSLRSPHACVLRAAYTPRHWPRRVRGEFKYLAGVAVRLTLAEDLWPARGGRCGLEEAAASRLSAALLTETSKPPIARLKARASGLLGRAVVAYWRVRAEEGLADAVA